MEVKRGVMLKKMENMQIDENEAMVPRVEVFKCKSDEKTKEGLIKKVHIVAPTSSCGDAYTLRGGGC